MTTNELLTAIVSRSLITDEMVEKAQAMLDVDAKSKANGIAKRAEKASAENAPLIAECVKFLADGAHTASEIAIALDISTPKATVIAKAVPNVVIGSTKLKGRSVKTYSL